MPSRHDFVGSAGVFVVDTKAWREVSVHAGRIHRGQEDVTDDVARLADLVYGAEAALAEIGLPPGEVHAVVALAGRRRMQASVASVDVDVVVVEVRDLVGPITKRNARLFPLQVDQVLGAVLKHFPVIDGVSAEQQVIVPEPVFPRRTSPQPALVEDGELAEQLLDGVLEAPIEEWMAFLDPSQAKLVRRNFNGLARIRGATGTGKHGGVRVPSEPRATCPRQSRLSLPTTAILYASCRRPTPTQRTGFLAERGDRHGSQSTRYDALR